MKSNSNVRPPVFQDLGDGSWYYNYNIVEIPATEENGNETTVFEYDTTHFYGAPEYKSLVDSLIAERYSKSAELAMINGYTAYTMKLSTDIADKDRYEEYLREVSEIKAQVKADLIAEGFADDATPVA
jgi:hypothetical protein